MKGGVAEADGRLMQGDQILAVNGEDMRNATQEYAAGVLKVSPCCPHPHTYGGLGTKREVLLQKHSLCLEAIILLWNGNNENL